MGLPHGGGTTAAHALNGQMVIFQERAGFTHKGIKLFIGWIGHQSTKVQMRQTSDQSRQVGCFLRGLHSAPTSARVTFHQYGEGEISEQGGIRQSPRGKGRISRYA